MMIAGLIVVGAGAMAMFSACHEKIWGAKIVISTLNIHELF